MNGTYFGLFLLLSILAAEAGKSCGFVAPEGAKIEFDTTSVKRDVFSNIGVYINILTDDAGVEGFLDTAQVQLALDALNDGFSISGLQFELLNTRVIKNTTLFNLVTSSPYDYLSFFEENYQGNKSMLNIYVGNWTDYLGTAILPSTLFGRLNKRETFNYLDFVYVNYKTLPGVAPNDPEVQKHHDGKVLVHNVGHWFGLLHPYEGGCTGGDFVQDTPAQAYPHYANLPCDGYVDSCPSQVGLDDITNYMDLSSDQCTDHFTYGQILRMYYMYVFFRLTPEVNKSSCTGFNNGELAEYQAGAQSLVVGEQSITYSDNYVNVGRFFFDQSSTYYSAVRFVVSANLPVGTKYKAAYFHSRTYTSNEPFPTNGAEQLNFEQFKYHLHEADIVTVDLRTNPNAFPEYQNSTELQSLLLPVLNPLIGIVEFSYATLTNGVDVFPLYLPFYYSFVLYAEEPSGQSHKLWAKGVEFQHYLGASRQNNPENRCRANNGFVVYGTCLP